MTQSFDDRLAERAGLLPSAAHQILSYAAEEKAAGLLICDRNARPLGYAIEALARETGQTLPPTWYVRVSQSVSPDKIAEKLALEIGINPPELGRCEPVVTIVDEHISKGTSKLLATKALACCLPGYESQFVTLTGRGADLAVYPFVGPNIAAPWRDMANVIGFEYSSDGQLIEVPTPRSKAFYAAINEATCKYADANLVGIDAN